MTVIVAGVIMMSRNDIRVAGMIMAMGSWSESVAIKSSRSL